MNKILIGSCTVKCETWNPQRAPCSSFSYIDIAAVDRETKSINTVAEVPCDEAPSRARQLVRSGDILVSTVRPNLNAVAMVPGHLDGATASTGYCVLRPESGVISSEYLFHWVKTSEFVTDMTRKATGANYPAVSDRIVRDSLIPLPPLAEQKRIAAILDQAHALRKKRSQAIVKLDELLQSVFLDMFGDPVTNPKGWDDSQKLGDVADIASGITVGRKVNGQHTREVPYLAVINVQDRHLNLNVVKKINATEQEIERFHLEENDLLLTEGGDYDKLGRGTLWKNELSECIHQNHIFRVRLLSKDVHPCFLNYLVGSFRGKRYFMRSAKQTTGIASINMTQLRGFPLLVPPIGLQSMFASRLKYIEQQQVKQQLNCDQLDTLFASLQQRAFKGTL